jgi:hypothetical protein
MPKQALRLRAAVANHPVSGYTLFSMAALDKRRGEPGCAERDYPNIQGGGNAFVREGIHSKYGVDHVGIPVSRLHEGPNTIALVERRIDDIGNHVMYDYLNLELP